MSSILRNFVVVLAVLLSGVCIAQVPTSWTFRSLEGTSDASHIGQIGEGAIVISPRTGLPHIITKYGTGISDFHMALNGTLIRTTVVPNVAVGVIFDISAAYDSNGRLGVLFTGGGLHIIPATKACLCYACYLSIDPLVEESLGDLASWNVTPQYIYSRAATGEFPTPDVSSILGGGVLPYAKCDLKFDQYNNPIAGLGMTVSYIVPLSNGGYDLRLYTDVLLQNALYSRTIPMPFTLAQWNDTTAYSGGSRYFETMPETTYVAVDVAVEITNFLPLSLSSIAYALNSTTGVNRLGLGVGSTNNANSSVRSAVQWASIPGAVLSGELIRVSNTVYTFHRLAYTIQDGNGFHSYYTSNENNWATHSLIADLRVGTLLNDRAGLPIVTLLSGGSSNEFTATVSIAGYSQWPNSRITLHSSASKSFVPVATINPVAQNDTNRYHVALLCNPALLGTNPDIFDVYSN